MKVHFTVVVAGVVWFTGCSQLGLQSPACWSEDMLSRLTLRTDDTVVFAGKKVPATKEIIFFSGGRAGSRHIFRGATIIGYVPLSWSLNGDWLSIRDDRSGQLEEFILRRVGHWSLTVERRDGSRATFSYDRPWQKPPNQSPEPTPGSVTPRATAPESE
jgi:hypothetical protein